MISPRRKSHVKTQLGLKKVQVVALRCEAQRAVFSRCPFKGYHDILYAKIILQFYKDCDIDCDIYV